jgi:hypothetical protein
MVSPDGWRPEFGDSRVTTMAPLPAWRDLADLLAVAAPDDDALAAPWRRGNEGAVWFSRGAWALAALVRWWQDGRDRPARLWLPDYFCDASSTGARDNGAELVFYPVGEDLQPRWPVLRALARSAPPDLFAVVHYFGQAADGHAARAFCAETGALMIEDAAHVTAPAPGIGVYGDFVLYCPHKTLAVPDGAVLLVRDRRRAAALTRAGAGPGHGAPAAAPWLARRLVQKCLPAALLKARVRLTGPAFGDDPPVRVLAPTPALSRVARRTLTRVRDKLAAARRQRRRNEETLRRACDGRAGCRPFFASAPDAPYRFVLDCADGGEDRFLALRRRGCPAETWPDLPPEVLAEPERHAAAVALRRRLVFLPVHQSVAPRHLSDWLI